MKHLLIALLALFYFTACNNDAASIPADTDLQPKEFNAALQLNKNAVLLDVRTPEEFSNGHLNDALNYDWNDTTFESKIAKLEKNEPIFVYCLSGGRSGQAAEKMRTMGFTKVYELKGGIMKWRAEGLTETKKSASLGMTKTQYDALLDSEKYVLVDFYAEWCMPCKKMKPFLEEIEREQSDRLRIVRINADEHPDLCRELNIESLPTLQLYQAKKLVWLHVGFSEKKSILEQLK